MEHMINAPELPAALHCDHILGFCNHTDHAVIPHIVIGDFDHGTAVHPSENAENTVTVPCEKDDTDTMLACRIAMEHGAHRITIVGGTGGRIDHSLSNVFLLEQLKEQGIDVVLCDGNNRIRLLSKESVTLSPEGFPYFSLIALDQATVSATGCKYPLEQAPLHRSEPYAVSNEITSEAATVTVSGGPVLLIESGMSPI